MEESENSNFNIEESFVLTLNLGNTGEGEDQESQKTQQVSGQQTLQENSFLQQSSLCESFPIDFNKQSINSDQQNLQIKQNNSQNEQDHNKVQKQKLFESFNLQQYFENIKENNDDSKQNSEQISTQSTMYNSSLQGLIKEESFKLLESFPIHSDNFKFTTYEAEYSKTLIQHIQEYQQLKKEQQDNLERTLKKGKDQQIDNLNKNDKNKSENEKEENLFKTQVINETDKNTIEPIKLEPTQLTLLQPDVISHTNQNIKKIYQQCFQLKSQIKQEEDIGQKQHPQIILENAGKEKVIIGRSPKSDLQIKDQTVSSKHAQIVWNDEQQTWCLSDEGSTNGTYLIVHNAVIKQEDELLIGLHLCRVLKIIRSFPIEIELLFENAVEDEIPPFLVKAKLEIGKKFMIGKKHQKQLQDDFFLEDDHCYILFENQKIKIQNCENVFYKTAKKLDKTKQIDLNQNSVIRFGFINQYQFNPYKILLNETIEIPGVIKPPKKKEVLACIFCNEVQHQYYTLEPCKHSQVCIMCANKTNCKICGSIIVDFQ